jgi:hypothetical protein
MSRWKKMQEKEILKKLGLPETGKVIGWAIYNNKHDLYLEIKEYENPAGTTNIQIKSSWHKSPENASTWWNPKHAEKCMELFNNDPMSPFKNCTIALITDIGKQLVASQQKPEDIR